ncbi:MAG: GNAT family N-acetyltransferase, partial [Clostridia bacterium]|nr:GNAT family N-acetyltransferase [Clostridia bacterium]
SMARRGANTLMISGTNPVSLDWRIPGTPGHDHNNMPGADVSCAGYPFLLRCGFTVCAREVALYGDLSAWVPSPDAAAKRERLRAEGIETGPYDPSLEYDFDQMCTNVGSEYWRDVLRTEIAAWKAGQPNADPRFWADGLPPRGPRMLLTAIHKDRIVGFTGPVDRQQSGRGWFTGICTDPAYERRGVATVLFDLLLQAFVREGASFCSLFTGWESHARKIYEKAGLRPVRRFDLLSMPVSPSSAAGTVQGKIG